MASLNAFNLEIPKLHSDKLELVSNYLKFKEWKDSLEVFSRIIRKSKKDTAFLEKLKSFIEDGSTIALRELCEPFGSYWDSTSLSFQNAVDGLDTAFGKNGYEMNYPMVYPSFILALSNALLIKIDGDIFKITAFDGEKNILYFNHPDTFEEYSNSFDELYEDVDGIELIGLKPIMFQK